MLSQSLLASVDRDALSGWGAVVHVMYVAFDSLCLILASCLFKSFVFVHMGMGWGCACGCRLLGRQFVSAATRHPPRLTLSLFPLVPLSTTSINQQHARRHHLAVPQGAAGLEKRNMGGHECSWIEDARSIDRSVDPFVGVAGPAVVGSAGGQACA